MLSERIRSAVNATFGVDQREEVIAALSRIPDAQDDTLRVRPAAEFLAAAVLVLAYGNRDILFTQLTNAVIEPRDDIYVLQSPALVESSLTCGELVRRYQELNLPVPEIFDSNG